jgi:hypothetical protein
VPTLPLELVFAALAGFGFPRPRPTLFARDDELKREFDAWQAKHEAEMMQRSPPQLMYKTNHDALVPEAAPELAEPQPIFGKVMVQAFGYVIAVERQRMRKYVAQEVEKFTEEVARCALSLLLQRARLARSSVTPRHNVWARRERPLCLWFQLLPAPFDWSRRFPRGQFQAPEKAVECPLLGASGKRYAQAEFFSV